MPRDPRNYITVHNGMPENPKVEPLSDAAFRLLIESWCYCDRNNTDGAMSAAVWARRSTRKARTELVLAGLVDETKDGVTMHDYDQHQRTAAEKVEQSAKRAAAGRAGGLAKASNALASATAVAKQTASKPVAELEIEKEEEVKDSSSSLRDDVERVCSLLADRIEGNGAKRPRVTKAWRDAARLMMDNDGRSEESVTKCINWCQSDEFWRSNILSMPKLREKYDQLALKARTPRPVASRQQETNDMFARAAQRAVEAERKAIA